MRRQVVIQDEAIETLAEALIGLTSQVENLADEIRRHQHLTTDKGLEKGSAWSGLNDTFRHLSFEAVNDSLAAIKKNVEDLLP